ncbi:MAG: type I DNA topoisomerase [Candidatus Magasanikiibacteriota bacterium]
MPKLVIVESPTKAKTISKFLGSGFVVESSFGHLRDLPKSKMGIDIDGGTFEPDYVIPKDKAAQVKKLKDLAKKSSEIIFATDEDREGEAISWHLTKIFDIDPSQAKRIAFHEITKTAIEDAIKNPRNIDQKLVDAQQARRILDRLVGYELSPMLWKKVARGLSAGRVQSVAVRLVVEKEREIKKFVPEEYWSLGGIFNKINDEQTFLAKLYSVAGKKLDHLDLKKGEEVNKIMADLKTAEYFISEINEREAKRTPPPPFTTSTLQQAGNQKLGYSSKQIMRLAQQLYEGVEIGTGGPVGLITYMRTDSLNLSDKFIDETNIFIKQNFGADYCLDKARRYKNKSKNAQEAHEAIRPTDPNIKPETIKDYLSPQQHKLYSLIWKRAVATQMAVAELNKVSVIISAHTYQFKATGQSVKFPGWLKLYPDSIKEEMLPNLSLKEKINCVELKSEQHFTEPPARYSDATLVKIMEEYGIGRPSTYAPTIATIEARGYVERDDNKKLVPKDIAFVVNDLLVEHFSKIVDYQFTAQLEENLDEIALGTKDWQPIIATFYSEFHENLIQKNDELTKENTVGMRELGTDPKSGKPIYVRIGRFGPYVQKGSKDDEEKPAFASLKKDQSIETVTLADALELFKLPRVLGQDEDGHDIIANVGRYGPYVQVEKKYYSIKEKDPYTIELADALQIIKDAKEVEANKIIKAFTGSTIQVLNGRYGPYITDGTKNAKIPKDKEPSDLTMEECDELIKNAPDKKTKWKRKK